jgi:hypothetical protein
VSAFKVRNLRIFDASLAAIIIVPMTTPEQSPSRSSVWLPYLAVILLTIPFITPFFANEFPDRGDGLLNLYRIQALDYSIRHGDLWPRFLPALHFGFGSPAFNYYAPLSIFGAELIHLLGAGFPLAYRISVMGYALMGALGGYQLGKAAAGRWAGIITAAAFIYAPPIFDTFNRLGQFAAVLLLPWVLWAFWRLATLRRRRDFVLAAGLFGALLLMHNVTALYAAPLAAVWAVFVAWQQGHKPGGRLAMQPSHGVIPAIALPLVALLFAMGLTAFFWVPALAEQEFVQLERLNIPMFDYHNGFLPILKTFALPYHAESGRLGAARVESVGWPQMLLGIAGLVLLAKQIEPRRGGGTEKNKKSSSPSLRSSEAATFSMVKLLESPLHSRAIFALISFIVLVFMTTWASTPLWHLPLVDLLLFPQRLLYGASLMMALLAGIGAGLIVQRIAARRPHPAAQMVFVVLCVVVIIANDIPNLHTNPAPNPVMASLYDLHEFERTTGWLGATSASEFLPVWVKELPDSDQLTERFLEGDVIPRLRMSNKVLVVRQKWGPTSADLVLTLDKARTLEFEWFYMPGWEATIDGQRADMYPTEPHGLIALDVPEGEHDITLRLRATPVQRISTWFSFATLVGLVVFAVVLNGPDALRQRRKELPLVEA